MHGFGSLYRRFCGLYCVMTQPAPLPVGHSCGPQNVRVVRRPFQHVAVERHLAGRVLHWLAWVLAFPRVQSPPLRIPSVALRFRCLRCHVAGVGHSVAQSRLSFQAQSHNTALNAAPFSRWTPGDKAARRPLAQRYVSKSCRLRYCGVGAVRAPPNLRTVSNAPTDQAVQTFGTQWLRLFAVPRVECFISLICHRRVLLAVCKCRAPFKT